MTKKNWMLVIFMLVLIGIYAVYFTDWFKTRIIQISYTSRPERPNFRRRGQANRSGVQRLMFGFDRAYPLTEVEVVPLAQWQTNHETLPVWHLVSDSNSVPMKFFTYGQRIRGMKPAVPGTRAQPLQPDVTYRLFVAAGSVKGRHDFETKAN